MSWTEASWAVELGRLLMHFLWQASLIGMLAALALEVIPRSPRARHTVLLAALGGLFLAPLATWWFGRTGAPPAEVLYGLAALPEPSPWLGASGVVWALGALVQSLRTAVAFGSVRRLRMRGVRPASPAVVALVDELRARLGVSRSVGVVVSTLAQVPTVVGTLKPLVLLPTYAVTKLSPAELRAVIAHELAHVRRFDDVVNWVLALAETLFFFHPAAWWIAHRLRAEREFCCDDTAVELCGQPIVFARALERLETLRPVRVSSSVTLASQGGPLMQRIQRLVRARTSERRAPRTLLPVAATLIGLAWFSASANAASPFGPHDEKEVREIEAAIERIQREITDIRVRIRNLDGADEDAAESLELGLELLGGARHRIERENAHAHEVRRLLETVEKKRSEHHEKRSTEELLRSHKEKPTKESIEFHLQTLLGKDGLLRIEPRIVEGKLKQELEELKNLKELKILRDIPILREHMEFKDKGDAHRHLLKALESVQGAQRDLGEKNQLLHEHLLKLQDRATEHGLHLRQKLEQEAPRLREQLEGLHGHLQGLEGMDVRTLHGHLAEQLHGVLKDHKVTEDVTKQLQDALHLYQGALGEHMRVDPRVHERLRAHGLELKHLEGLHKAWGDKGLKLKEMAEKLHGKAKVHSEHDAALEHYHRALQLKRQAEDTQAKELDERRAQIEKLERELKRLQEEV